MQTTTFDLNAAITEAVATHQAVVTTEKAANAAQERQRQEQQAVMEAREIAALTEHLRQDLGDALYDALGITVTYVKTYVQATAQIDGETWTIGYTRRPAFWCLVRPRIPVVDCTREQLRSVLLRSIAWNRQQQAEQQAAQEQQEAERQARRADHDRCQAQLAAALDRACADLWTWPEGQILTLYRWTWHIGDGDFEDAWSVSDRLDAQGYAEFYAEATIQTLRMDMQAHQPVVERRTFRAIEELPGELRKHVRIDVPGIWWDYSEEQYRTHPEASMTHDVGTVPCAWVRAQFTSESPS